MNYSQRGESIGIFVAFLIFNIFVLLVAAGFLKWSKR
jgi:ABC-type multidrug transport system permease subunit